MLNIKYSRILIKISGEALMGNGQNIFHKDSVDAIIKQIIHINKIGVRIGIVIGGGNIFRGLQAKEFALERTNADYMGIMATIMNGIALNNFLANHHVKSKLYSSLAVGNIVNQFNRTAALADLDNGCVVIFAGGTGNPFFTTDSGAALRALEMNADILIKATKVDGVYDKDPLKYPNAKKYTSLSFDEAIGKNLQIMDTAAFDLCRSHNITIEVCDITSPDALYQVAIGKHVGTVVHL